MNLNSLIPNSETSIPEYISVRKDRDRNRGVVLMYVREHISFCKRNYLIPDNLEMVYIQIIANLIANRFYT